MIPDEEPTTEDTTSSGEPLAPLATVAAAVSALLALLAAFGLPLTPEQTAAILGVVGTVGPLVVWWLGRRKVVPTDNVLAFTSKSGHAVAGDGAAMQTGRAVAVVPADGEMAA